MARFILNLVEKYLILVLSLEPAGMNYVNKSDESTLLQEICYISASVESQKPLSSLVLIPQIENYVLISEIRAKYKCYLIIIITRNSLKHNGQTFIALLLLPELSYTVFVFSRKSLFWQILRWK